MTDDRPRSPKGTKSALKLTALALVIGAFAVIPGGSQVLQDQTPVAGGPAVDPDLSGPIETGGPTDPGQPVTPGQPARDVTPAASGLECNRAKNGGATAPGVTATSINLASTVVQSGPGSSFLGESPLGMQAVVRKINAAGGVCGRLLNLTLRDDGWDAQRGLQFLRAWVNENKYFAFPVVPSSEGLTAAIEAGIIDDAGMPVVGTDGMLRQQYDSPWVWPVATATESSMRIMARYGHREGMRCFGIVWDKFYRFGKEGAEAFRKYVETLSGAKVCADVGILPAQASYSSEIQRFNSQCDSKCDFVAMLLEPQTALTWIAGRPQFGTKITAGAQTLFNEQFAANCGKPCGGMIVWTGYNPPIGSLAGLPDVEEYVNDVKTVSPTADTTNQFMLGAYLGMTVFVEALQEVGPDLTRARLQATLDRVAFKTDLASTLQWAPDRRHANCWAQGFSVVIAQGSFAGFKNEQTGFIPDPLLKC